MGGPPNKKGEPPSSQKDEDRPTVSPPFDPAEFARGTMKQTSQRPPLATITDPAELEHARLTSLQSNPALDLVNDFVPPSASPDEERVTSLPPTEQSRAEAKAKDKNAPKADPADLELEMRERYDLGDFSGARDVALELLQLRGDDANARKMEEQCRVVLERMFTSKLGSFSRVPVLNVPKEQLRWLGLDHKAGFLLSHVDGMSDIEMLLDVSGMPRFDALRILTSLLDQQVVSLKGA